MEIWFYEKCSKSQAAVKAVEDTGKPFTLRAFVAVPPTKAELEDVLRKLGKEPWEICRMKEPVAAELGLDALARDASARERWIALMVENPILIERPILVRSDGKAFIARSAEALEEALAPQT